MMERSVSVGNIVWLAIGLIFAVFFLGNYIGTICV